MSRIDLTRKRTDYASERSKEEYFLFAPRLVETVLGIRVHLGGRKNLIHLRKKIDQYLQSNNEENKQELILDGMTIKEAIFRQKMGESFIMWAEEYYSDGEETNLNKRIPRREIMYNYFEKFPMERKFTSPQKFREKLEVYCQWKGYKLNPQHYDTKTGLPMLFNKYGYPILNDCSGGIEYFTIGNERFVENPNEVSTNI